MSNAAVNDRVLGSDAAVAIGRFSPFGVRGYRASIGGPLRNNPCWKAEADQRRYLDDKETRRAAA